MKKIADFSDPVMNCIFMTDHGFCRLGKMLVEAAEQLAKEEGFRQMVLHGRQTAAGFYRKLGYLTDDVVFTELEIPHISFSKLL